VSGASSGAAWEVAIEPRNNRLIEIAQFFIAPLLQTPAQYPLFYASNLQDGRQFRPNDESRQDAE